MNRKSKDSLKSPCIDIKDMARIIHKEGQSRLECIEGNEIELFTRVKLDDKYNFINTEGQLVSNQWFDGVQIFHEGFAIVELDGKWNFINTEGQVLSQEWFDGAWTFYGGGLL